MPGETRTSTDFVAAALDLLAESGSEGLTIAALCARLQVTKGSFYHHFDGVPAFVTALLEYWETEHSDRLIALSAATPDPIERLGVLTGIALALPHAAESAIRAWARSNAEVAEVQLRVDAHRETHLTDAFRALGISRPVALLQARMALALLVGAQSRPPVSPRELRAMFVRLTDAFLGDLSPADAHRLKAALAG